MRRRQSERMKIVSYNVNGLRQRISQFGSLRNLLNSFDADILCFQETKLRRQELTADLIMADGYESFFSCTRTSQRGRTGYSGNPSPLSFILKMPYLVSYFFFPEYIIASLFFMYQCSLAYQMRTFLLFKNILIRKICY